MPSRGYISHSMLMIPTQTILDNMWPCLFPTNVLLINKAFKDITSRSLIPCSVQTILDLQVMYNIKLYCFIDWLRYNSLNNRA
jgi:hypothetical protein